jgi:hypothetical protein
LASLTAALLLTAEVSAQIIGPPVIGGWGLAPNGKRLRIVGFVGGPVFAPPVFGGWPVGYPGVQIGVYAPPVVLPPPVPLVLPAVFEGPPPLRPDREFFVIAPRKGPPPDPDGLPPGLLPVGRLEAITYLLEPPAERNPLLEADRQLQRGRVACADGAFGVALEHFSKAQRLTPDAPAPRLNSVIAHVGRSEWRAAVALLDATLKQLPAGAVPRIGPRPLYGPGLEEFFLFQLRELKAAAEAPQATVGTLYLYGYVLWADGRPDDARPWLERAARRADDASGIERLLGR